MILTKTVCSNCGKDVPERCDGKVYSYEFQSNPTRVLDENSVWVSPWWKSNEMCTWFICTGENLDGRSIVIDNRLVLTDNHKVYLEEVDELDTERKNRGMK
jgi:hypothetical protein